MNFYFKLELSDIILQFVECNSAHRHKHYLLSQSLFILGIGKDMKSLTPAIHDKIGKYFVDLYGDYAGWAHTVLFAADLKRFSNHKPAKAARKGGKPAAKEKVESPVKADKKVSVQKPGRGYRKSKR